MTASLTEVTWAASERQPAGILPIDLAAGNQDARRAVDDLVSDAEVRLLRPLRRADIDLDDGLGGSGLRGGAGDDDDDVRGRCRRLRGRRIYVDHDGAAGIGRRRTKDPHRDRADDEED